MNTADFRRQYDRYRQLVDNRLASVVGKGAPAGLREGCRYLLEGGGKRVRSTLVLLSCEAAGGHAREAVDAGVAVEMVHNFTLVHDDIMDNAPSRRGQPTVHTRWDVNTAILVGDITLGHAYRSLLKTGGRASERIAALLTEGVIDVCEGQGLDLELARKHNSTLREYFRMIEKKTARLMATAAEIGAVIGGGTAAQVRALRTFGLRLGVAFQIQDDLLDVVADERRLGKAIGGDILEGKKTFLLLRGTELARGRDRQILAGVQALRAGAPRRRVDLVGRVTEIYRRCGVIDEARGRIRRETARAVRALDVLPDTRARDMLESFAHHLLHRVA